MKLGSKVAEKAAEKNGSALGLCGLRPSPEHSCPILYPEYRAGVNKIIRTGAARGGKSTPVAPRLFQYVQVSH